jgi:hypothetical protein
MSEIEQTISSWLEAEAPQQLPDRVLEATFERTGRSRQQGGWRAVLGRMRVSSFLPALASAAVVVVVAALGVSLVVNSGIGRRPSPSPQGSPTPLPPSTVVGAWLSTSDEDGGTQRTTLEASAQGTISMVETDTIASVCGGTPSTMTATGSIDRNRLIFPTPTYTCDDGREPRLTNGDPTPMNVSLRNLTYVFDSASDTLYIGENVWYREGATPPSPRPSSPAGFMWPEATLDEARQAQAQADGADPAFAWQVDPRYADYEGWDQVVEAGGPEIGERFVREELGWDSFLFAPFLGADDFWSGGGPSAGHTQLGYLRCAPGETNALYPEPGVPDQLEGADRCAPSLDELRYEAVSIDLAQPVRQDATGIWIVSRWALTTPFAQADPHDAVAMAEAHLREFLEARLHGEGAEGYVSAFTPDGTRDVPLLYAATSGSRYERYEIQRVAGPRWPEADMDYVVRLFADGGATVVEQPIRTNGRQFLHDVADTTENGQPVPLSYSFLEGRVSLTAPSTWRPSVVSRRMALARGADGVQIIWLLEDPLPAGEGCAADAAPRDADALARAIASDPDLVTTTPLTVTIAGLPAVTMDVIGTNPAASICDDYEATFVLLTSELTPLPIEPGSRVRLFLFDVPEGSPFGMFAVAFSAPDSLFESVLDDAAPIIESLQLHDP